MASAQVDGYAGVDGARKEWLLVDEAGRDVLATPGKHYLPGEGLAPPRALAPLRGGKIFDVGAWRLRRAAGADVAAAAGADVAAAGDAGDDVRPWQIVGIMSRERLDELLEQKRQYDEDAARARRRGGGGAATEAVAFLPAASAGAGLENRRDQEARDAAQAERAKKSWW
ncbi:hypothetical protein JL720_8556 [Aureococcus anophagefferens]|nr:hypothetical protein JL720_8556 [Aureococcus anophagefferens]